VGYCFFGVAKGLGWLQCAARWCCWPEGAAVADTTEQQVLARFLQVLGILQVLGVLGQRGLATIKRSAEGGGGAAHVVEGRERAPC